MQTKRRWTRDRSAQLRVGVVGAGLALALAGCGTLMPGGNTTGGDIGSAAAAGPGPGVSDDSVKVVFIAVDLDEVQKMTKFTTASVGDQEKQIEALEDWVNANGGLGGKQMEAVFRIYDAETDTPAAEEQLCNKITQDDRAFAVVMTGQYQVNARPCYASRQTLVIDASLFAMSQDFLDEESPYVWTASFPEYDSFIRTYVRVLGEQKFFEGEESVGVVAAESPVNRDSIQNVAVPLLREAGIEPEVAWVDTTDTGTLFQGLEQAAVTFRSKGVERLMFLGGSRMASVFATVAGSQEGFSPQYAISSFDNPSFFVNNPTTASPETMESMVGIGFHPPQDVPDAEMRFPSTDSEKECLAIYQDGGVNFESRESARVALPYCDATRLLKMGAEGVEGNLNAAAWSQVIDRDGSDFQSASGPGNALGSGGRAAVGAYRVLRFDAAKGHFVYEGPEVPFDE